MTKTLFYDIETTPLKAYIWRLGDQSVRHGQLIKPNHMYDIISIAYAWDHEEEIHVMGWGFEEQDSEPMLKKFDELIREADVVIGKNSDRFDNKHLNFHRWFHGRDGMPDWTDKADDLEKHLRRNFSMPSQSLDYVSDILGLGGKEKMEFSDWVNIVEKKDIAAYEKMLHYNKKDVEDTRAIWRYSVKHFKPKYNKGAAKAAEGYGLACTNCGSLDLAKNGTSWSGGVHYQKFMCNTHHGYAGKLIIKTVGERLRA